MQVTHGTGLSVAQTGIFMVLNALLFVRRGFCYKDRQVWTADCKGGGRTHFRLAKVSAGRSICLLTDCLAMI